VAKVLLVDDDPDQLEIRKLLLEQAGHHVRAAHSAPEAEACCRTFTPQLVVMDLRLPHTEDGLGLIRLLRGTNAGLRIIVLTGWPADLSDKPEFNQVELVLSKPVRTRKLVEAIERLAS
jgi:CheY-like chemotaxis protein